jgi:23S rRNA (pseudouridine1915-N3)-methyltransferase
MKITILAIGKARDCPEMTLFREYQRRLPWTLSLIEGPVSRATSPKNREDEARWLLDHSRDAHFRIALDEHGTEYTSLAFSAYLCKLEAQEYRHLAFLIGGPDGHGEAIRTSCQSLISLGKPTWPHLLVRALLAEQLYRAWSIAERHPYHRS